MFKEVEKEAKSKKERKMNFRLGDDGWKVQVERTTQHSPHLRASTWLWHCEEWNTGSSVHFLLMLSPTLSSETRLLPFSFMLPVRCLYLAFHSSRIKDPVWSEQAIRGRESFTMDASPVHWVWNISCPTFTTSLSMWVLFPISFDWRVPAQAFALVLNVEITF